MRRLSYFRGDKILKVLEAVGNGVSDLSALFEAFLRAGYGASQGKISYEFSRARDRNAAFLNSLRQDINEKLKFQKLLSKLKNDGLVRFGTRKGSKKFSITQKGLKKIKELSARRSRALPRVTDYKKQSDSVFTIIAFDIPEKEKRKREWLRAVLKNIGFIFIQDSVSIGKVKVPAEFLDDLKDLKILDFVEIFQITKLGSLKHIE